MERNGGSLTGRDARTTNSLPFHENRPEQRMELCFVGRQAQLAQSMPPTSKAASCVPGAAGTAGVCVLTTQLYVADQRNDPTQRKRPGGGRVSCVGLNVAGMAGGYVSFATYALGSRSNFFWQSSQQKPITLPS